MGIDEDGHEPSAHHVVRSDFETTGLVCSPAVAAEVGRLCAPYFRVEPGRPAAGHWTVSADEPPPRGAVPVRVNAQGENAVEYAVDHESRILYHVAPRDPAWVVQSLVRSVRAVHRSTASRGGAVFVHAGLIRVNGIGVALVGGSRAGKTSLIMASVLAGVGRMVCNDDISLVWDDAGIAGVGWPRSISVRLDTMDVLFGRARAASIQRSLTHPANETLHRLRDAGIEPNGTALMYSSEYVHLLGTEIGERAPVDAVVHLSLADYPADVSLRPLDPRERRPRLLRHLLGEPNKHLNIFGHTPPAGSRERLIEAAANLPTFAYRYHFTEVREHALRLADYLDRQFAAERLG